MSKIYDCFLFSYSPDLLEIRLNVLDEVVDQFVIVEADRNWNGMYKGFIFTKEENLKRFEKFLHKITYVAIEDMPEHKFIEGDNVESAAYRLEQFNRNAIVRGLDSVEDSDIIVVSDFDEIPRPKILKEIQKQKTKDVVLLSMTNFFYKLNSLNFNINKKETNSVVFNKKMLEKFSISDLRWNFRQALHENQDEYMDVAFDVIYDSGWHFTWVGDKHFLNEKLNGYRHQESRNLEGRKHFEEELQGREDYTEYGWTTNVIIDSFFPDYIVENQEKYSHLISKNVSSKSGYDFVDRIA